MYETLPISFSSILVVVCMLQPKIQFVSADMLFNNLPMYQSCKPIIYNHDGTNMYHYLVKVLISKSLRTNTTNYISIDTVVTHNYQEYL